MWRCRASPCQGCLNDRGPRFVALCPTGTSPSPAKQIWIDWQVNAWEIQRMYRASNKRYRICSLEFLYLQSKNCSIQHLGLTSRCLIPDYLLWSFCVACFNDVQSFREVWYATRHGHHHWNHFQIQLPWGVFWGFGVRSISQLCKYWVYGELWQVCSDLGRFVHAQKCRCSTRRWLGIPFGVDL